MLGEQLPKTMSSTSKGQDFQPPAKRRQEPTDRCVETTQLQTSTEAGWEDSTIENSEMSFIFFDDSSDSSSESDDEDVEWIP